MIFLFQKLKWFSEPCLVRGWHNFCTIPWEFDFLFCVKFWNCVGGAHCSFFIQNHFCSIALQEFYAPVEFSCASLDYGISLPAYWIAHAKVFKWNFEVQFPGNWYEFVQKNDFETLEYELSRLKFHTLSSEILKTRKST